VVLLQGPLVILMLTVTAAGITAGERLLPVVGLAGASTTALLGLYLISLVLVKRVQRSHPWTPDAGPERPSGGDQRGNSQQLHAKEQDLESRSLGWVTCLAAMAAAGVFAAGTVLALSGDALAEQTGLGSGFVGLILGGAATSLPELSTTISSVRLKQYEMAFSDAFGTNLCSLAVLFLADILYGGGPILNEVGRFSTFAVLLGIWLTTVYLAGLVARPRQAVWRMGFDSLIVLATSAVGFLILYRLK
jgi:cation:H+ antiporter